MKPSNIYIALIAVALLASVSYWNLNKDVHSSIIKQDLPMSTKEFVWVRTDSLANAITRMTNGNVQIDTSGSRRFVLNYKSKQYLLHEITEGMNSIRKHLLENDEDLFELKEDANGVKITLKRKDEYVYCPAAILGRVLQSKSKYQD
jgi:hypothetical protein